MPMLAIFGISGKTGQALALAAAARGWQVQGLVRSGSTLPANLREARLIRGALMEPAHVAETVAGARAVCCTIGPRAPYKDVFCAAGTGAIIAAMKESDIRRLVCQTGAMIGAADNRSWLFERMARAFTRRSPTVAADRIEQERVVRESGLEWTIVKPPRLKGGEASGSIQAGPRLSVGLLSSIRRADLAQFLMDVIEEPRYVGMSVFVRS